MNVGFNLELDRFALEDLFDSKYDYFYKKGSDIYEDSQVSTKESLDLFKIMDNELSASKIMQSWFPKMEIDIFLSHSHKDEKLAICFAGWLYEKFKLKTFIDSMVWGYANDLLKVIDNNYCLNGEYYSYQKRNYSTAHVHMMLVTSIINMIDKSKCAIFLNTPNSFIPSEEMNGQGMTSSPWIFTEILIVNILQEKKSLAVESFDPVPISYTVESDGLIELTIKDLKKWNSCAFCEENPLRSLYKIKGIDI